MLLFIFHKKYRSSRRDHIWILSVSLYTAHTHAHTSIHTLKSLVNFCSRDFLFNEKFDDSTLAKRHIVGHFVRSDTGHVMQTIDVTRPSRITQQLVPSTTILSFVRCSRFACKKSCSWLSVRPSYVLSQPVHKTATDWEDDTRCCINTIQPPDDEHVMLETCRGL